MNSVTSRCINITVNRYKRRLRLALSVIGSVLIACSPAPAQESATVTVPELIKAGELLRFTIKLDKAPNFDGGTVQFTLVGPDISIQTSTTPLSAGQSECSANIQIPAAATGGKWHLRIDGFYTGTKRIPLKSGDMNFEVIAKENLVFPSSAEVRINPSQVQLLRTAAKQLQLQVQNFKAGLVSYKETSNGAVVKLVQNNIGEAIESLNTTQSSFHALAGTTTQPIAEQVFFDDLRSSYETVLAGIEKGQLRSGFNGALNVVSYREVAQTKKPEVDYTIVVQAALRPFEQNELAYKIVADTESLAFDLSVNSNPAGAAVCYHRRGDPCRSSPDTTNTVIKSLPYALWLVQFQKAGYLPEEREHDPFRDPNHVINVELRQQGKIREHQ
jgi:hypothetical protein